MTTMPGLCRTWAPTLALACFFLGGVGAYSKCCMDCLSTDSLATCSTRKVQYYVYAPDGYQRDYWSSYGTITGYMSNLCTDCVPQHYRDPTNCLCTQCLSPNPHYSYEWPIDPVTGVRHDCIYANNMVDITKCTTDTNWDCQSCSHCQAGTQCYQETSAWYQTEKKCTACPAGTYRNEILNEQKMFCQACKTCNLVNRERRTPCGPVYDSTCVQCGAGNIVTQSVAGGDYDTCTTCNSGSYPETFARAADNKCAGCITCPRTQKQTSPCQATADRVCANCIDHQRSNGLNGACDGCDGGYVRGVSGCIPCEQAGCGNNQYIKCVTSADNMGSRDCLFCQGHNHASSLQCNPGYGVSTFCTGNSTAVVTCALCEAGTERPAGTALVPNGDSTVSIQKCIPCATGKYKAGVGAGDCQACGNKPVNSVYAPWSTTVAGTAVCPW